MNTQYHKMRGDTVIYVYQMEDDHLQNMLRMQLRKMQAAYDAISIVEDDPLKAALYGGQAQTVEDAATEMQNTWAWMQRYLAEAVLRMHGSDGWTEFVKEISEKVQGILKRSGPVHVVKPQTLTEYALDVNQKFLPLSSREYDEEYEHEMGETFFRT